MNRIILVLGCHRSGTSLITKSLESLGVNLGTRLQPAAPDNPAGFYEDLDFQIVNQAVLQSAGADWDTLGPVDIRNASVSQIVRSLVDDRTKRFPIFGVKDPRFCRTLPFWRKILGDYAEISCVYVLRNPMDVAASLKIRNGMDIDKGLNLWLVNMLDALTEADPFWPRVVVDYDRMIEDPMRELTRMSDALDLPITGTPSTQPELRHHKSDVLPKMENALIVQLYDLLRKVARDEEPVGYPTSGKFLGWASELCRMAPLLRAIDAKKKAITLGHRFGEFRWP